jgi:hypothetical protein
MNQHSILIFEVPSQRIKIHDTKTKAKERKLT